MLLATNGLGLESVRVGVYLREDRMQLLRCLLGILDSILPFSLLRIGYPGESKESEDRFGLSSVYAERW